MRETREEQTRRRRWLNLAELVGVAGVLIAALGLYLTWSDRRDAAAERSATVTAGARLDLSGTVAGDTLRLSDARHDLTDVAIRYPAALGVGVQRPAGDPAIEAATFREPLLRLTDGGEDDRSGRLPVLVTASYLDGDATRTASGIYDIVWATHGRMGRGRALEVTGLRLRQRGGNAAALERVWAREKP